MCHIVRAVPIYMVYICIVIRIGDERFSNKPMD
nr:MAG TPA: hypothetical protein [Caudoviricetes sp.]